mmetsp:Transcript_26338/g.65483  ORF Transcript_26338/g.65483 Transcript_26338/m.65483 type:complete len:337 (+) Transcript_26338:1393-2403(+)
MHPDIDAHVHAYSVHQSVIPRQSINLSRQDGLPAARSFFLQPVAIAPLLYGGGEVGAASEDHAPLLHDAHSVGLDEVQQPLVVGDDQECLVGMARLEVVDGLCGRLERVDVKSGVGLIQDDQIGVQHHHLQDLVALLLTAREAGVDAAVEEGRVEAELVELLKHLHRELNGVKVVQSLPLPPDVDGRTEEVRVGDASDLHRVLEGQEDAGEGPLVDVHVEDVLALESDGPLDDAVVRVASDDLGQSRLAAAVGSHDGMHLAFLDLQTEPIQDLDHLLLLLANLGVHVVNPHDGVAGILRSRHAQQGGLAAANPRSGGSVDGGRHPECCAWPRQGDE